jgi:DNA-binding NarL/FixJ family response regulator
MENTAMSTIRILIVDDHPLIISGVAAILSDAPDMLVVGEASDGQEGIELFRKQLPDVTLMDLQMPRVSGLAALGKIRAEAPDARVIVLTTYKGDVRVAQALRGGAYGYLLKTSLRKELVDTIRAVHAGRRRIPPDIAMTLAEHQGSEALTEREIEVLQQIAEGNANKEIATNFHISDTTVKGHVRNILAKLNTNDRTHAVTIALKRGIIELEDGTR